MAAKHDSSEMRKIKKLVRPLGFVLDKTGNHFKFVDKNGAFVIGLSGTASDRNAHKNILMDLARKGALIDTGNKQYVVNFDYYGATE